MSDVCVMFRIKKIKQLNYLNISQYHVWQKIQDVGKNVNTVWLNLKLYKIISYWYFCNFCYGGM